MPMPKNLKPICKDCGLDTDDLTRYKKSTNKVAGVLVHTGYRNLCNKCANARVKSSSQAWLKESAQSKKRYIQAAKAKPCADCNVSYPYYVMQFDHLPQFEKSFNLSSWSRRTLVQIEQEIAKCEVVCGNCHAERGHVRRVQLSKKG